MAPSRPSLEPAVAAIASLGVSDAERDASILQFEAFFSVVTAQHRCAACGEVSGLDGDD